MASRFKTSKDFFDFAKSIHGNKFVYDETSYSSLNKKISLNCPNHGIFQQLAHDHIRGHGCKKCHSKSLETWTEDQDKFLIENYDKGSFWCASQLNKTDCAIRGRAKKIGIATKQRIINSNIPPIFWGAVVSRALDGGFKLEIDADYVWDLYKKQKGKCALTGRPIKFVFSKTTKDSTASLDRIDSKKDYVKGNVQLTHKIVNRCKLNCPEDVFFAICKDVYLQNKDRFEKSKIEWEMDIWNDREIPVRIKEEVDYEDLNFADFKRENV